MGRYTYIYMYIYILILVNLQLVWLHVLLISPEFPSSPTGEVINTTNNIFGYEVNLRQFLPHPEEEGGKK